MFLLYSYAVCICKQVKVPCEESYAQMSYRTTFPSNSIKLRNGGTYLRIISKKGAFIYRRGDSRNNEDERICRK